MDTRQEIVGFISSKATTGALLVTGKWGCGKTHLIKDIAKEINAGDSCLLLIVSLFGVESVGAIDRIIKEKIFYAQTMGRNAATIQKKTAAIKERIAPIVSALKEHSAIARGIDTALSVNLYDFVRVEKEVSCVQNDEIKKKKLVLVFDDLERARVDLVCLLGAVNAYTESAGIKTILIADEDKINSKEYSEFKEKLIVRTIKLAPAFEDIVDSIIKNYEETQCGYQNFLKRNAPTIQQVFAESGSQNLRSLKAYLVDFERVFAAWNNTGISKENLTPVFYLFGAMTFGVKNGSYKEGPYGYLLSDTEMKKTFTSWQGTHMLVSLRNWAVDGIWSESDFRDEVKEKYRVEDISDDQKFLAFPFWDLEQEHITNGLPIAVERAITGDLTRNELVDLLVKIFALKKYSVPIPCEIDYESISEGFRHRKEKTLSGEIIEPKYRPRGERTQIEPEAIALFDEVEAFDTQLLIARNRRAFVAFLSKDMNVTLRSLKDLPIGTFDDEMLAAFTSRYFRAENYWKREMAHALLQLGFADNFYISAADTRTSVKTLSTLAKQIEQYAAEQTPSIYSAIYNSFVCGINELVAALKEKI